MKEEWIIKFTLCDSNKNFGEIISSIWRFLKDKDGVSNIELYKKEIKK